MYQKSPHPILLAVLLWLPHSCSDNPIAERVSAVQTPAFSVAEARAFYECEHELYTRSDEDTAGSLTLGAFEPLWDDAQPSEGWDLQAVDAPVSGDFIYRLSVGRDNLGRELGLRITHRLIVLRQKSTGDLCPYLIFYLPDSTYAAARPLQTAELCETLLSCAEKASFTGLALYTRTDGTPIAAQRYDEGIPGDAAFLFDEDHSAAGDLARLNRMLDGIILWQIEKTTTRVKSGFDLNTGEDVVDVIITGKRLRPDLSKEDPLPPHVKSWKEYNPTLPPAGGGGGGSGKYAWNENLRTDDPKVIELLDKLMEDCMGQVLIGALNHPIKIITQNTTVNGYNPYSNPPQIHLIMNPESKNIHDIILLEELFHAYQRQRLGNAVYEKRRLNCEIEAKLAWLMYRQREGNLTGILEA